MSSADRCGSEQRSRYLPSRLVSALIALWSTRSSPPGVVAAQPLGGVASLTDGQLMARLCGSTETRTGKPCERRRNSPCSDHRGRTPRHSRRRRPKSAGAVFARLSTTEKTILEIAVDATTDGWPTAVAKRGSNLLGRKLWGEVQATGRSGCAPLAAAARQFLEAKEQAHELLADLLVGQSPADRAGQCLWEILRNYVKKVPIPGEEILEMSARGLRIIGVYLCTVLGDLNRCECLADLAEAVGRDKLEEVLTAGLNDWADKITPSGPSIKRV
jgi:hypothetical protein